MFALMKGSRAVAFAFVFASVLIVTPAPAVAVVPEYRLVQRAALELLRACPPAECVMIFSGRSGTVVAAYLEALIGAETIQVPLSDFRHNPRGGGSGRLERQRALKAREELILQTHFDSFIDRAQLTGKRIFTVDYAQSGMSQMAFTAYLNRWLEARGIPMEAIALPLASGYNGSSLAIHGQDYGVKVSKIVDLGLFGETPFVGEQFDKMAAYGSYNLLEDLVAPVKTDGPSPEYRALVAEIAEKQMSSKVVRQLRANQFKVADGPSIRGWIQKVWSGICRELIGRAEQGTD